MSDLWLLISNNVPEFILLVVGTLLIAVEIFLPGFGIPGIAGIIAMAAGLILMDPTLPQAVILLLCAGSVLGILVLIAMKTAARDRIARSALVNSGTALSAEGIDPGKLSDLVGSEGTTLTVLRPAGTARFGDKKLDVVSDGEFIPAGTPVKVVETDGNRVVVRASGN